MCSRKVCTGNQTSRKAKELAKALIDLKKTSVEERKEMKQRIVEKFKLEANEKWVATKLRLMMINLGSCKELLSISSDRKQTPKGGKISQHNRTSISRISSESKKKIYVFDSTPKARKPRQSLEERQLTKLRALGFDEPKVKPAIDSKLKFLEAIGLMPTVIAL